MSGLAKARAEIDFDPARLRAFLATALPDVAGELEIARIGGGQSNPTYFVTQGTRRMVLRKRPNGDLPKSAHDVGREYRIISALIGSPVPVPPPILFHEAPDVVGTPFYLMERVDGRVFMDQSLPDVPAGERRAYFRAFAQGLATLHAFDWRSTDLAALARPGRYLERQVDRWSRAWSEPGTAVTRVVSWLRAHLPADEAVTIVHGDYKFTNMIFDPAAPRIAALLDWELCAIGDPLADLAHSWMGIWATTPDEYGGLLGLDLPALGIPTADEFLADYYAASNSDRRLTAFHKVLALLRNAGIFHGIGQRAAAGTANAADAGDIGGLDRVFIDRALEFVADEGG